MTSVAFASKSSTTSVSKWTHAPSAGTSNWVLTLFSLLMNTAETAALAARRKAAPGADSAAMSPSAFCSAAASSDRR